MRRFLLTLCAVLALLAAHFLIRGTEPLRTPDLAPTAAGIPASTPVELESPRSKPRDEARADAIAPADPATMVAAAAWTGVRVQVTAVEDGRPLPGVRVRASCADARRSWLEIDGSHGAAGQTPQTDAKGFAEVELAPGEPCSIEASGGPEFAARGSSRLETPLAVHEIRALALALRTQPDVPFHGRVIDRETSSPIVGARVGRSSGWREIAPAHEQRTDADGRFRVDGTSWLDAVVDVIAEGYEFAWTPLLPGHATADSALEITLSRVATARVTALDATGGPIEGAKVTLSCPEHDFGRPQGAALIHPGSWADATFDAITDARGVAVLADLPPRMPLDGLLRDGGLEILRAPEVLTLAPGESRDVLWRIGAGCTIHGVALEADGTPAAGLAIGLESARGDVRPRYWTPATSDTRRSTRTDGFGRFVFSDVGAGPWRVGPEARRRGRKPSVEATDAAPHAQLVTVLPGASRVDVEIRVHRGLTIEGRVLDPQGNPVARGSVGSTHPSEGFAALTSIDDAEGRFVLGPLEAGAYELRAHGFGEFAISDAVPARTGDKDVVLRLQLGATLRGVVVEKGSSTPVESDVEVRARPPVDASYVLPSAGRKGSFELTGLGPGVYDVAASTPSGLVGFARGVEVAAGATQDMRVELERGARVRIRFEGPWPTCALVVLAGETTVVSDGIERGAERIFVVPAGPLVVRVQESSAAKELDLPLTIQVGETRDLVFDGKWK